MAVEHINENQFKSVVLESDKPVLVDFFATWCGPCRQMSPILDQVSEERSDVKIVKVDVDENQNLAAEYGAGAYLYEAFHLILPSLFNSDFVWHPGVDFAALIGIPAAESLFDILKRRVCKYGCAA